MGPHSNVVVSRRRSGCAAVAVLLTGANGCGEPTPRTRMNSDATPRRMSEPRRDCAAGLGGSLCLALSFLKVEMVLVGRREIGDEVCGPLVVSSGLEIAAANGPIVYGIINWIFGERSGESVLSNPCPGCLLGREHSLGQTILFAGEDKNGVQHLRTLLNLEFGGGT